MDVVTQAYDRMKTWKNYQSLCQKTAKLWYIKISSIYN